MYFLRVSFYLWLVLTSLLLAKCCSADSVRLVLLCRVTKFCSVSGCAGEGAAAHLEQSIFRDKMLLQLFAPNSSSTILFAPESGPPSPFSGYECISAACDPFFFSHSLVPSFLVFSLSLPPLPDADFLSLHHIELSVSVGPRVSWSLMDGEHVGGAAVLNRHGGLKRWGSKC